MENRKAVIYINQFFGQVGGEESADFKPVVKEGAVGSALAFKQALGEGFDVTHTVICGDNFMGTHTDEAVDMICKELENVEFDVFFAGPAFRAGRYGFACGTICKAVKEKFNVPVYTSMNDENPGVELFKKDIYIFKGGASAVSMKSDVKVVADFAKRQLKGEETFWADKEGYYGRGVRHQVFIEGSPMAADRAVDMLLKVIAGEDFQTELPIELAEMLAPAPAIKDLSKAKIALVTSGGIVPLANPDKIQSASATRWGKYDISQVDRLESGVFKTIHAGYDPTEADKNPNIVTPIDALKALLEEGVYGSLHPYFYSTVGTGTTQSEATRMGEEIAKELLEAGVDGVILTST